MNWSIVGSFDPALDTTIGALQDHPVANTHDAVEFTMGSRRTFDDVVSDIRVQVSAVSRKV